MASQWSFKTSILVSQRFRWNFQNRIIFSRKSQESSLLFRSCLRLKFPHFVNTCGSNFPKIFHLPVAERWTSFVRNFPILRWFIASRSQRSRIFGRWRRWWRIRIHVVCIHRIFVNVQVVITSARFVTVGNIGFSGSTFVVTSVSVAGRRRTSVLGSSFASSTFRGFDLVLHFEVVFGPSLWICGEIIFYGRGSWIVFGNLHGRVVNVTIASDATTSSPMSFLEIFRLLEVPFQLKWKKKKFQCIAKERS